jgi:hypothetical protein
MGGACSILRSDEKLNFSRHTTIWESRRRWEDNIKVVSATEHHTMKTYGRREKLHTFLTSVVIEVTGEAYAPRLSYPFGKGPRYPLTGRLGGPQAGLDVVEKNSTLTQRQSSRH